jgi:hypothetical protein
LIPLTDSSLMALTLSSHLFSASVFPLPLPFPLPILQVSTFSPSFVWIIILLSF